MYEIVNKVCVQSPEKASLEGIKVQMSRRSVSHTKKVSGEAARLAPARAGPLRVARRDPRTQSPP